jgi:hypothetical protein
MKTPHEIRPNAVYDTECLRATLLLTKSNLAREIRLRRLRVAKRAGRYFVLGIWVLQWLRDGELRREPVLTNRLAKGSE